MILNNKTIQPGDYVMIKNASNDKDALAMIGIVVSITIHKTAVVLWETFIEQELPLEILQRIDHGSVTQGMLFLSLHGFLASETWHNKAMQFDK